MSEIASAQSPLSSAQVLARLAGISPAAVADVDAALPVTASTPIGIAVLQAQTIQDLRIAGRPSVPAGVKISLYTNCR